jgi:hypothetical protein
MQQASEERINVRYEQVKNQGTNLRNNKESMSVTNKWRTNQGTNLQNKHIIKHFIHASITQSEFCFAGSHGGKHQ